MLAQTKTAEPTVVNGINVDALHVLIEGVRSVGSVLFETGLLSPPIADIGADMDFRREGPVADLIEVTALER